MSAARTLSPEMALRELVQLHEENELGLDPAPRLDGCGRIVSPKGKVYVKPTTIAGVEFQQVSPDDKSGRNTLRRERLGANPLYPALVVLLYRLAVYLKTSRWGVTSIRYGGLGSPQWSTRHFVGRAIDFYGAETNSGLFLVLDHWGHKSVPRPEGKKHWPAEGWPADHKGETSYRLKPFEDNPSHDFFLDVYNFLTEEAADTPGGSEIGGKSYIITPDHPSNSLRGRHQNHIHFEVPAV